MNSIRCQLNTISTILLNFFASSTSDLTTTKDKKTTFAKAKTWVLHTLEVTVSFCSRALATCGSSILMQETAVYCVPLMMDVQSSNQIGWQELSKTAIHIS